MVKTEWRFVRLRRDTYDRIIANMQGMDSISDVIDRCLDARTIPKDQTKLVDV